MRGTTFSGENVGGKVIRLLWVLLRGVFPGERKESQAGVVKGGERRGRRKRKRIERKRKCRVHRLGKGIKELGGGRG